MNQTEVTVEDSQYCRKCPACRCWVRRDTLRELENMFAGPDGQVFRSCQRCREKRPRKSQGRASRRVGSDLGECYETHEEFVEAVSSFLEEHDNHKYDSSLQTLRIRANLASTVLVDNDISIVDCALTADRDLQKRPVMLLRNDILDCAGYYFHLRHAHERHTLLNYERKRSNLISLA